MKRQSDEEKFISELLGDDGELSRANLEHGRAAMRRKRARRTVWRVVSVIAPIIVVLAASLFEYRRGTQQSRTSGNVLAPHGPEVIAGTSIRVLSDAELLEFFKDRPVALVGRPGNQRLILFDEVQN